MLRNIEIKANVTDLKYLLERAEHLCTGEKSVITQHDIFYNVHNGRLKLRRLGDGKSVLVYYDRPNTSGPKLSKYILCEFPETCESDQSNKMHAILSISLGVKAELKKIRHLFMAGQTRIHVDEVEGLGNFMELEVVLEPTQTVEEGEQIAKDLYIKLGVKDEDLLEGAYVDLVK